MLTITLQGLWVLLAVVAVVLVSERMGHNAKYAGVISALAGMVVASLTHGTVLTGLLLGLAAFGAIKGVTALTTK